MAEYAVPPLPGVRTDRLMSPLRDAFRLPVVLVRYHELLMSFVKRELRARIEGSILGRMWPVLQPVVLFAIYYLVFAQILKIGFSDDLAPHGEEHKGWRSTFYLITGILPWTVLAESLNRGSQSVLENANLIKKIAFPSELLPTYNVVVFHVYFLIGFVLFLALELIVNGGLPVTLGWLLPLMIVQFLFINGLTMFLAALNIFVRDVMQGVPVFVTFWMFTTPVFYDLGAIEKAMQAEVANGGDPSKVEFISQMTTIMNFNPMALVLDMYRAVFSFGKVPFPTDKLLAFSIVAVVVQYFGYAFFLRCKGRFADEV